MSRIADQNCRTRILDDLFEADLVGNGKLPIAQFVQRLRKASDCRGKLFELVVNQSSRIDEIDLLFGFLSAKSAIDNFIEHFSAIATAVVPWP